ncbi:NPC intracellular cholesterol transporter 2-like [Hyalella azteca]|uniref:NPC intracellular cholesterol transporter 2-like n=1 Tax=Hyalella azteca TaxID=294128 RepID=A0A979FQK4_HYAAZ|nr:NPC intracellular cholesterol transporter 2-like [Hyalella azteca]
MKYILCLKHGFYISIRLLLPTNPSNNRFHQKQRSFLFNQTYQSVASMRIVIFLFALSCAAATEYQDCGSAASNVVLGIPNCDVPPCIFQRGDSFNVTLDFYPKNDGTRLTASITALIGPVDVPWPGFDTDACRHLSSSKCPFTASTQLHWGYEVEVLKAYPAISTIVTFKMLNEDISFTEVCVKVPVHLV